jgi:hypothetical protein
VTYATLGALRRTVLTTDRSSLVKSLSRIDDLVAMTASGIIMVLLLFSSLVLDMVVVVVLVVGDDGEDGDDEDDKDNEDDNRQARC